VSLHRQPPGPPAESVLPDSERGRRNFATRFPRALAVDAPVPRATTHSLHDSHVENAARVENVANKTKPKTNPPNGRPSSVVRRLSCPSRVRPSRVFDRTLYAHTTYLCSTFDSKVRPVGLVPSLSLAHHDPSARRPISRSISQCSPPVLPSRPSLRGSRR